MSPMVIEFLNVNMLRNQLAIDYFSGSSCFTQKKQGLLEEWCIVGVSDLFSLNSIAEPEGAMPCFSVDRHLLYIMYFCRNVCCIIPLLLWFYTSVLCGRMAYCSIGFFL